MTLSPVDSHTCNMLARGYDTIITKMDSEDRVLQPTTKHPTLELLLVNGFLSFQRKFYFFDTRV